MRVLHLYAGNLYGGIERLLVTLAQERNHCPQMQPHFGLCFEGQVARELRAAGVPVHLLGDVRFSRPWTVWRARRALRDLLRCQRFERVVCHAPWPHALFAPAVRAAGVPLVFWAHDVPTGTHWLERRAACVSPALAIANSRYTRAGLSKLFPNAPSRVLYCPVPLPVFPEREAVRQAVRVELRTGIEDVVIVIACRMESWKGHRLLLAGLGRLRNLPDWQCWIVGGTQRPRETAYLTEVIAYAGHLGIADRVQFLGHRSDVPRLFAAADIHCQPNTGGEPFGIAFIEALAAGLPVVTTRLGAASEILTDACGLLVQPDDPAVLADALCQLIADPARRTALGVAGPTRASTLCDPRTRIPELHDLLTSLARAGVAA